MPNYSFDFQSYPKNSINPVITDMNQSVLADVRLSLGLLKMIVKI